MPEVTVYDFGQVGLGSGSLGGPEISVEGPTDANGYRYLAGSFGEFVTRDGVVQRGTSGRQRVISLIKTSYGSAQSMRGRRDPDYIDENTEQLTRRELLTVLAPAIEDGTIRVSEIIVEVGASRVPGRIGGKISFTDLRSGRPDEVNF